MPDLRSTIKQLREFSQYLRGGFGLPWANRASEHDAAQQDGGGDTRADCPYVGLTPFTEEDAEFFFGRERERRIIAANLRTSRLTLLYGSSGVGKSSVLRAGV